MGVTLEPITKENLEAVFELAVAPGQERFVAPNPWSLAQAYAEREIAWPRAIVADGSVVGFLMLEIDPDEEDGRSFWLWRLMVAADRQRSGFGSAALGLAIEHVRSLGADAFYTSWVPGDDGPEAFYLGHDFEPTGELDDDEIVAVLRLDADPTSG